MKTSVTVDPRLPPAVLFDLDGVVTDSASMHAAAWTAMFDDFLQRRPETSSENHTPFTDHALPPLRRRKASSRAGCT